MVDLERFQKIIELIRNMIAFYKNGDNFQKGLIIHNSIIELQVEQDKLLKIKEKEPFYWLSLLNVKSDAPDFTNIEQCKKIIICLLMSIREYKEIEKLQEMVI